MDVLEQAGFLYRKLHDHAHVLTDEDQASLNLSISRLIRTCLVQLGGAASFRHTTFGTVIRRTVGQGRFQGDRAAAGFQNLEKYLLLLVEQPWKREFWLLKTYGGFFCTKVKAHLECPEQILHIVGYLKPEGAPGADDTTLILENCPDPEQALSVAFDCQVAAIVCRQIGEYHEKMKCVNLDLSEAMNVILSGGPNDSGAVSSPAAPLACAVQSTMNVGRDLLTNGREAINAGYVKLGATSASYGNHGVTPVSYSNPTVVNYSKDVTYRYVNQAVGGLSERQNAGLSSASCRQTITAAGGMGVVSDVRPPPVMLMNHGQMTRLEGRRDYVTATPPLTDLSDSHLMRSNVGVGNPASRPPTIASTGVDTTESGRLAPKFPSRFPSSAYAPSSGYGSAPASSVSAASSAYAASSGYGSASQTSQQYAHTGYTAGTNIGHVTNAPGRPLDHVDYTHVPNDGAGGRHLRPNILHNAANPPAFPFIDEESPVELATPFPEATHDEHVLESIKNFSTPHTSSQNQHPAKSVPAVVSDRRTAPVQQQAGTVEGVPYDDWNWFHRQQGMQAGPSDYNTVVGAGSSRQTSQTAVGPQTAPHYLDRVRQAAQPATAVTAMLTDEALMGMKRHVSPLDNRLQRAAGSGDYPLSEGRQATGAPLQPVSRDKRGDAGMPGVYNLADDGTASQVGYGDPAKSQTVFHPPSNDSRFQRHSATTVVARTLTRPNNTSTFVDMSAAGGKAMGPSALLARQANSGGPVFNNLDKVHTVGKALNVRSCPQTNPGGSNSAVIMREKVGGSHRASSLVSAGTRQNNLTSDLSDSRHGSRSMDLGSMKWRCRACTMENSSANTICLACSKSRDVPEMEAPTAGESKRVCPRCTLENAPGRKDCEACGTPLPDEVHTFV